MMEAEPARCFLGTVPSCRPGTRSASVKTEHRKTKSDSAERGWFTSVIGRPQLGEREFSGILPPGIFSVPYNPRQQTLFRRSS
jgi:hypothetical protein